jgi:phenylpyruvate tautomerase PptA (4-oxalocrotonate tautomerase family)
MPLVRIDLVKGKGEAQLQAVADAIHAAIVEVMGIPERDRFQIITEHDPHQIIAQDAGLGFARNAHGVIVIEIITQTGRTNETKQRLYATIAASLAAAGVPGEDVFISYVENTSAGRAGYSSRMGWPCGHSG